MNKRGTFYESVKAGKLLSELAPGKRNDVLFSLADYLENNKERILGANAEDCRRMDKADPKYDRLVLTEERIRAISSDLRNVAGLDDPLGKVIIEKVLDNGLKIKKIRVPLGLIGIIYEARPNVTIDVFSLCFKTGNAVVLKGGSDAYSSNSSLISIIQEVLQLHQVDKNAVLLLPPERSAMKPLLEADGEVDLIIPRGSQALIDFVRANSRVPVIETGAGIVHTYFDESGDLELAREVIFNAKTRRVSVCNALDCLLVHRSRLPDLSTLVSKMEDRQVRIYADASAFESLRGHYAASLLEEASEEHFGTEFLDYKMAIKTVDGLEEALDHIQAYSSRHSEAIISGTDEHIEKFLNRVDAAAVYANTSTAFTDGAQFGLGAEIGISTQKLHARGPMGLEELCSYKWLIYGEGQTRK